ncbi:MAG: TRAP transporter small permease [Nitratireductor sp.]|nr:TRAP transporter small permease [Nitratireductor sp.]
MAPLRRIVGLLCIVTSLVAAIAMVAMMFHIITDAILRNFFATSAPGTTEFVSFYYMVAVTFLPLAYIQAQRGHVIIEIFTQFLPARTRLVFDGLVALLISGAAGYFCYAATWKAIAMTRAGEFVIGMILVQTWPARWMVVIGMGLLSAVALLQAIDRLYASFSGQSLEQYESRVADEEYRLASVFERFARKTT